MSLPFTSTAKAIYTLPPGFWNNDYGQIQGPFDYSGAIWLTGFSQDATQILVAKSIDGGTSWTIYSTSTNIPDNAQTLIDTSNGLIYFVGPSTHHIRVVKFNLSTLTFGANVDSSFTTTGIENFYVLKSSGDIGIFYTASGAVPRALKYVLFSGGAFGTPVVIDVGFNSESLSCLSAIEDNVMTEIKIAYCSTSTAGNGIGGLAISNAGTGYAINDRFYVAQGTFPNWNITGTGIVSSVDGSGGVTGVTIGTPGNGYVTALGVTTENASDLGGPPPSGAGLTVDITSISPTTRYLLYNTLSDAGVVGARRTIDSGFNVGSRLFGNALVLSDGRTIFTQGWVSTDSSIGEGNLFYEGTPVNGDPGNPFWRTKQLPTYVGTDKQEMVAIDASAIDGTVWFLYDESASDNPSTIVNCMRCRYDGTTIFAQELVWDILNNPPVTSSGGSIGNPTFVETDGLTANVTSAGLLRVGVNTTITVDDDLTVCYFAFQAAIPIPPTPSGCDGEVRLQIFDDGVGEYVADLPVSTLLLAGDNGIPFWLPSPIAINKRGLLTVSLANVQSTNESVNAHIALMFAVPKKDRWKDLKS